MHSGRRLCDLERAHVCTSKNETLKLPWDENADRLQDELLCHSTCKR